MILCALAGLALRSVSRGKPRELGGQESLPSKAALVQVGIEVPTFYKLVVKTSSGVPLSPANAVTMACPLAYEVNGPCRAGQPRVPRPPPESTQAADFHNDGDVYVEYIGHL